jgi:MoaA/NifB/PqqE/SkfB family radical SAM enzyme
LKDAVFLNKLIREGVSQFYLPIYGADARTHEAVTRVTDSFQDTMKTLDNLCQYRIPVILTTIFTKKNFKNISALTEFIINKHPQMYFKIDSVAAFSNSLLDYKHVTPPFEMAIPFLKKTARIYKKRYCSNLTYLSFFAKSFLHLPLCILYNIFDRDLFKLSILIRHSKFMEGHNSNESFPYESLIKLPFCKFCKFYMICCGISKFYIKVYGRSEFKYLK